MNVRFPYTLESTLSRNEVLVELRLKIPSLTITVVDRFTLANCSVAKTRKHMILLLTLV